jgi:hypothetical protein
MPVIVNLDVMLARRKVRSNELARAIGITESNLSLLKSGRVKAFASPPWPPSVDISNANRATSWATSAPIKI